MYGVAVLTLTEDVRLRRCCEINCISSVFLSLSKASTEMPRGRKAANQVSFLLPILWRMWRQAVKSLETGITDWRKKGKHSACMISF